MQRRCQGLPKCSKYARISEMPTITFTHIVIKRYTQDDSVSEATHHSKDSSNEFSYLHTTQTLASEVK